jgi:hypothetical protein
LAIRINSIKIAESHRPLLTTGLRVRMHSISGGVSGGWVMIDSGMDETVHKFFGFVQVEPYWADRNAILQQALIHHA